MDERRWKSLWGGGGSLCKETESENNWIHSLLALLSHRSVTGGVSSSALLSVISSQAAGRSDGNLEEILPLTFSCAEADEKANETDVSLRPTPTVSP